MATTLYGLARANFLECTSAYSWTGAAIQLAFITSSYSPTYATDQYLGIAVSSGYIIAQSGTFSSTTATLGTANAANETVSSVTGSPFSYVTLYAFITNNNSSPLILNIDTATGLPCTPNGGNIVVQWDTGTNKIFTLLKDMSPSAIFGMRIVKDAILKRFGFPVLDETYRGFYAGVPTLHKLEPTPEQQERQARWESAQRFMRRMEKTYSIPALGV